MKKLTNFIVGKPKLIIILSVILLIPALIGYIFTDVNYDLLKYLPLRLGSSQGEKILSEEFNSSSMAMVISENMSKKKIISLKNDISKIENVYQVIWIDSIVDSSVPADILPDELKNVFFSKDNTCTMMYVQFNGDCSSKDEIGAVNEIKSLAADYKTDDSGVYVSGLSSTSADTKSLTEQEAPIYISIAVVLAIIILLLTMESYVQPFIVLGVLGIAVVLNMGTNIFLGSISYITQSIAAILQLGVTIDYSIFLINRYKEEKRKTSTKELAMVNALNASISSLSGSSLTTLSGFLALCFMQLTLGFNIGIVMAKGVVIGVLSVLVFLPAYLLVFDNAINKHTHKPFDPDFKKIIVFVTKKKNVFAGIFVVLLILSTILTSTISKHETYNISASLENQDSNKAMEIMRDEFNMTTSHFIVVSDAIPSKTLCKMENELQNVDGINSFLAYNQLIGTAMPGDIVPDNISYICRKGGYQVMLANSIYEASSDECNEQVAQMNSIVEKYVDYANMHREDVDGDDYVGYVTGEGALYSDLINTTKIDFSVTSIVSIVAIFIVIALIFKSFTIPVLLILSIELAIMINESISILFGSDIPFIAPTIISCVQLGATVDYAILLTSRFNEELSRGYSRKKAIKRAARESMHSVFQSALLFFSATFGVYVVCRISMIKSICAMLARGSIISMLVILFFLTPILVLSEKWIAKTSKNWRKVKVQTPDIFEFDGGFDDSSETDSYTEFVISDDNGKGE